ncbi:MATE family efflux transporter, partial [bacterium LRH843]|nr:MATE family efflux transporter [bacterium LRH843]
VLIFGYGPAPALGMAGAGLGTLIARGIAFLLVAGLALGRGMIAVRHHPFRGLSGSARDIVGTALPSALSRGINPAGMAAVTAAVA